MRVQPNHMTTYHIQNAVREMGEERYTESGRKKIALLEEQWKQFLRDNTGSKLTDAEAEIVFRKAYEHNYGDGYYAVEDTYALLVGYHLLVTENRAG